MKTITYDETKCQLVPKEITEEMGKAGANEWLVSNSQLDWYRALLSAAPQPVAQEEQGDLKDRLLAALERATKAESELRLLLDKQEEQKPVDAYAGRIFVDKLTGKRSAVLSNSCATLPDMTRLYTSPPSFVQAYNEGLGAAETALDDVPSVDRNGYDDAQATLREAQLAIRALKKTQEQQVAPAAAEGEER